MKLQSTVIVDNQIKLIFEDFEIVLDKKLMSNNASIDTIESLLIKLGVK